MGLLNRNTNELQQCLNFYRLGHQKLLQRDGGENSKRKLIRINDKQLEFQHLIHPVTTGMRTSVANHI